MLVIKNKKKILGLTYRFICLTILQNKDINIGGVMYATKSKAPKGILGFPIAPFTENNKLDEQKLAQNIQFLLDEGLEALFVACAAGEYPSLSKEEYKIMVDIAVNVTKKKVPATQELAETFKHHWS